MWGMASALVVLLVIASYLMGGLMGGHTPVAHASRLSATCHNTTADATIIQANINASAPGDQIVIKGPCLISATIKLADNRTYRGDSRTGTVLKQADGANLPAMLASSSWVNNATFVSTGEQIQDLTLDGNKDNNTAGATVPLMLRTWDSRIYNLEVQNAPNDGIRITSLSQNGTPLASGNHAVNNVFSDLFIHGSDGAGFHVVDPGNSVTDGILERSWIADSGTSGVSSDNAAGWQFRDLHLYGVPVDAIDADRCFGTGINDNYINDNYIEDFGHQGAAGVTYYGIHCTVQGNVANVIAGNKVNQFHGAPAAGSFVFIGVSGRNGAGEVSVTGNAIYGAGSSRETGLAYSLGDAASMTVASTGKGPLPNNLARSSAAHPGVSALDWPSCLPAGPNQVGSVGTIRSVSAGVTVTAGQ